MKEEEVEQLKFEGSIYMAIERCVLTSGATFTVKLFISHCGRNLHQNWLQARIRARMVFIHICVAYGPLQTLIRRKTSM